MCLIAFAHAAHPQFEFVLIGNRDEFHGRASAPAGPHPALPHVYGGRDLEKGGSWLLVSQHGRLAAVTNVRAGAAPETAPRSRGALVHAFAASDRTATDFADALRDEASEYGRFNLLLWDGTQAMLVGNHPAFATRTLTSGVHGLSNGGFDAAWPKIERVRTALRDWLATATDASDVAPLFAALRDETPVPDDALPDTGVNRDLERLLAPPFVRGTQYGSRASSVVLVTRDTITFCERRFGPDAAFLGDRQVRLPRL